MFYRIVFSAILFVFFQNASALGADETDLACDRIRWITAKSSGKLALGPKSTLLPFSKAVDAYSIADLSEAFGQRISSIEHFDNTFRTMVVEAKEIYFNLETILGNPERMAKFKGVFERYFEFLKSNYRIVSFYGLSNFPNYASESVSLDRPTISELELFIIAANVSLAKKTKFFTKNVSGNYQILDSDFVDNRFPWIKPMFAEQIKYFVSNHKY